MERNYNFRFSRQSITWNGEAINAELQNYSDDHMKIQREWWYGKPIPIPVPKLRFVIPEDGPMPDNYWNATLFDLYSPRLVSILKKAGISHELYPVDMAGRKSGKILPVGYQVFRLLEIEDVLDRAKSVFRHKDHHGQPIEYLEKPVFKDEFLELKKPLVRIHTFEYKAIIHVDLISILEKEGISGCCYFPL